MCDEEYDDWEFKRDADEYAGIHGRRYPGQPPDDDEYYEPPKEWDQ